MRSIALPTLIVLAAASLGAGCATTTKITTDPPGATVTLDNGKEKKELGKTPLSYESKMWIWESEKVVVKAPGRKPKTVELKRSEFDALPFVGGACVGLLTPYCLCLPGGAIIAAGGFKFPAETKISLEKDASAADATPPPDAPAPAPAPPPSAALPVKGDTVAMTY